MERLLLQVFPTQAVHQHGAKIGHGPADRRGVGALPQVGELRQPRFQRFQGVPILMISSIEESPDDRFGGAGEVGMIRPDRYLTKPLDVPRFVSTVRQLAVRA